MREKDHLTSRFELYLTPPAPSSCRQITVHILNAERNIDTHSNNLNFTGQTQPAGNEIIHGISG
jgi:hypothetical protein